MLMVRPVEFTDITALEQLAQLAGASMTTLPLERNHLNDLIAATQEALHQTIHQPASEIYHFVLVDTVSEEVLGIAGIDSTVGIQTPFYSYRMEDIIHASNDLQIHNRIPALKLCHDHTGYSRLCTFYIRPDVDTNLSLQLLSRARLLFIAEHRDRFAARILVELQGIVDEDGKSPFWEDLGHQFFTMDMAQASYLTGICDKSLIADLMPKHPIYTLLLSKKARSVIGEVRPDRMPAQDLLEQEGFSYEGYVDIFDAGPSLEACIDRLYTVSQSTLGCLNDTFATSDHYLIANTSCTHFRCMALTRDKTLYTAKSQIADMMRLDKNNTIRMINLFP
ncbi:arginine N-succinyltransferase [Endozoicomonas sp. Mp262]|uniref:arginine N-succinyltransferase n=1 Tax=Endozoicomonas sp. Mp262 TaxID=2919499 RepID=UPI0021D9C79D